MARGKAILQQTIQKAAQGDLAAFRRLKDLVSADCSSPDVVDLVFQSLIARSVPTIADPKNNIPLVAIAGARPALGLNLFWKVVATDTGAQPDIKEALIHNLTEHSNAFCRWSLFCLRSGHNSLPEDMLAGDSSSRQERYLLQARLLLQLLDLDPVYATDFLCSEGFNELFLELWYAERSRDGPLVCRMLDAAREEACPIVLLAQRVMKDKLSKEAFLERCSTKKHYTEFSLAITDRVTRGDAGKNTNVAGWFETLVALLEVTEVLWTSSQLYHWCLRKHAFLMQFGSAWNPVSSTLVDHVGFNPDFTIFLPPLVRLIIMSFSAPSHASVRSNWKWMNTGDFWESFVHALAIAAKTPQIWKTIPPLFSILSIVLVYPKLVPMKSSVDLSVVEPLDGSMDVECWNRFASAFRLTQEAKAVLVKRANVHMCYNPSCTRPTTVKAEQPYKQCQGCFSVAYCCTTCQADDWQQYHRDECCLARRLRDARKKNGSMCGLETIASQTALLEVTLQERADLNLDSTSAMPVFDFTAMHEDSIGIRSYKHDLSGTDAYWDRKGTVPSSFAQSYLRLRLESFIAGYVNGTYPSGWRLVEGIFPQIRRERVVHLTVLLEPVEGGFRSVHCIARDRPNENR